MERFADAAWRPGGEALPPDHASLSAGDPCVEAGPDGGLRFIDGCRGPRPVVGDFVVGSGAEVSALCARGSWLTGDLTLLPGAWSRAGLACLRGVEGRLELDLTDATGLEGLDRVIRVGELAIIGEGDLSVDIFEDLLRADVLDVAVRTTDSLTIAPQLAELGDLRVDSPQLLGLWPRWPITALDSLRVEAGTTFLDLEAIGDVRSVSGDVYIERGGQNVDGLQQIEEVGGDLRVLGVRTNMESSLRALVRVGGTLELRWTGLALAQFPSLEEVGALDVYLGNWSCSPGCGAWWGFGRLRRVYGDLSLRSNRMESVSGFNALEQVDGDLTLRSDRHTAWSAAGFGALEGIGGQLSMDSPGASASVFPALRTIGGAIRFLGGRTTTTTLPALEEVGSLPTSSGRDLDLPALLRVHGDVTTDAAQPLRFGSLDTIDGTLRVTTNTTLPVGLGSLREAGGVSIGLGFGGPLSLPNLERVGRLWVVTAASPPSVRRDLIAVDLPALVEADTIVLGPCVGLARISMPNLQTVAGDMSVTRAQEVVSVELGALESVGGGLELRSIASMLELGLPSLRAVGGDLELIRSGSLVRLSMPALEQVAGTLVLDGNTRLTDVEGLEHLSALGGLHFADNDRLMDLPAMPGLSHLSGDLTLDHNLRLEALGGLSTLRGVDGALQITDNRALWLDEIDVLIDNLDAAPSGGSAVSGNGR